MEWIFRNKKFVMQVWYQHFDILKIHYGGRAKEIYCFMELGIALNRE